MIHHTIPGEENSTGRTDLIYRGEPLAREMSPKLQGKTGGSHGRNHGGHERARQEEEEETHRAASRRKQTCQGVINRYIFGAHNTSVNNHTKKTLW